MLTPERERTALSLLTASLDREDMDVRARLEWLEEAAGRDPDVIRRVIELMEADAQVTALEADIGAPLEVPPLELGVWRLEAMIGAGGMGSVYRARRNDGLFDQTVAIKFMRARQGEIDLAPLIDAERRTLARMDHPSIARILDGGVTEGGLSYLVMEFVAGEPIDEHALRQGLSPEAAVALVRQVAGALAHAHQSRVVHCDVKPANILVTEDGRAKLIDFGIARLQEVAAAEGLDGVTRAYASPERCARAPATLSDDVYSLAVTLYELLAGELPWDAARADACQPAAPLPVLEVRNPGDLAAILAKAVAVDPAARYRSMEAFDADLAAWQGAQPVSAVPRRFVYLARRYAQRRPLALAAMVSAAGAALVALAVITNLYLAAEASRRQAEERFDGLRALAGFMIFDLNAQLEQVPGATPARHAMSARAQAYLDALGETAGGNAGLQAEVATGLVRLAEVQGVSSRPNLGETEQAIANLERARGILDGLVRRAPGDAALREARARALYFLAVTKAGYTLDPALQLSLAEEAEPDALEALAAAGEAEAGARNGLLLGIRMTRSDALQTLGDVAGARDIRAAEEARLLALPEAARTGMDFSFEAGRVAALLGDSEYYLGSIPASREAYARAAERFETGLALQPTNRRLLTGLHYAYYSLSSVEADLGDPAAGLAAAERSREVALKLMAWDPSDRLAQRSADISLGQVALMLQANGRAAEALAIVEQQLVAYRAAAAANPSDGDAQRRVAVPMRGRAEMVRDVSGREAGCRALQEAAQSWAKLEEGWGLSDFDRTNDVRLIAEAMQAEGCR
ncbi:protein kinase domain-containing protein [Hyphomonas sp.]|uniref:protein kinase domain-containing protein n=1 Tax=Hyphomonas sp. TaxID=87 RepID=UPI0039198137